MEKIICIGQFHINFGSLAKVSMIILNKTGVMCITIAICGTTIIG